MRNDQVVSALILVALLAVSALVIYQQAGRQTSPMPLRAGVAMANPASIAERVGFQEMVQYGRSGQRIPGIADSPDGSIPRAASDRVYPVYPSALQQYYGRSNPNRIAQTYGMFNSARNEAQASSTAPPYRLPAVLQPGLAPVMQQIRDRYAQPRSSPPAAVSMGTTEFASGSLSGGTQSAGTGRGVPVGESGMSGTPEQRAAIAGQQSVYPPGTLDLTGAIPLGEQVLGEGAAYPPGSLVLTDGTPLADQSGVIASWPAEPWRIVFRHIRNRR